MLQNSEIRKYMIGSWRQGELAGEGSGIITLTIKEDGTFSYIVTRGGILSRTMSFINGSNHLTGSWVLKGKKLSLYVKKFNDGVAVLIPFSLLGTAVANVIGLDYGGDISSLDEKNMVLNETKWERV
ncbi:hypothetical protein [Spirulina sp. 06S082]|uniref:hypothetical protein n=1 Tax=Spirulina sp. 06S082 TaxID=3110248 RepID=UPI002B20A161|nr:hypothetical protein [Spirulina sp. 06S082]MEA5469544.1 hypothetical protein [Spirulina sp. 06S082]